MNWFRASLILCCMLPLLGCQELQASLSGLRHPIGSAAMSTAPEPPQFAPVEEISVAGLRAWVVRDTHLPLVSIQIIFEDAGAASDPEGLEGRAMFAAALLDEGAGDLDALAFQQALDDQAIELSFSTDDDVLVVDMRSLAEHLPEAFRLLGLALNQPRFADKDIKLKRAAALSMLRQAQNKPDFVLAKTFHAMAYPNHPYGHPPLGMEKSIRALSKKDLLDYVDTRLAKDQVLISAAGDINLEQLTSLMKEHLGTLPEKAVPLSINTMDLKHQGVTVVEELDVPQSLVLVATPSVDRRSKRFLAAYILNHIVGGDTFTSVLGSAIRKDKGLAYSVRSYLDPMSHSSNFKVRFATRNEEAHIAYETLKTELEQVGRQGVSKQQFKDAVDYITGSFVLSLDNNANMVRYLGSMQRYDLGKDYLQTRNEKMRAVTQEEVNALAGEMFNPDQWLTVIVGKPQNMQSGPKADK